MAPNAGCGLRRILVTGSRDWTDSARILTVLMDYMDEEVTLVSGACPTGADASAENFAEGFGWTVERHPADWSRGRKAGPERNAHMVNLGADVCLAFIGVCTSPRCDKPRPHASHGATGCADLAQKAGIPVRRIYDTTYVTPPGATARVSGTGPLRPPSATPLTAAP